MWICDEGHVEMTPKSLNYLSKLIWCSCWVQNTLNWEVNVWWPKLLSRRSFVFGYSCPCLQDTKVFMLYSIFCIQLQCSRDTVGNLDSEVLSRLVVSLQKFFMHSHSFFDWIVECDLLIESSQLFWERLCGWIEWPLENSKHVKL